MKPEKGNKGIRDSGKFEGAVWEDRDVERRRERLWAMLGKSFSIKSSSCIYRTPPAT